MKTLRQILKEGWEGYPNTLTDSSMDDLHDKLNKKYRFGNDDKKSFKSHMSHSFGVNNHLWEVHHGNKEYASSNFDPINYYKERIKNLDTAINNHKTPHDLTVYSGIGYDPRDKMNSNKIVHHPAYLSTSIDKGVAENFSLSHREKKKGIYHENVIKINVPKGHVGAYIGKFMKNEKEFLLPRGLKLKHLHTETIKGEYKNNYGTIKYENHLHHMEIV